MAAIVTIVVGFGNERIEGGLNMGSYRMDIEIKEAMDAGNRALQSLRNAENNLGDAGKWGIVDMLGGGLLVDLVKHSKMDNASGYMEQAKHDLQHFQRELKDVQMNANFSLNIGDFLNFADFFFDGFIADYLVQSKIRETQKQLKEAISQVERVLRQLQTYQY